MWESHDKITELGNTISRQDNAATAKTQMSNRNLLLVCFTGLGIKLRAS